MLSRRRLAAIVQRIALPLPGACALFQSRAPPPSESVDFSATAEIVAPGDSLLRVRVVARNGGTLTWTLEFGPCSMNVRVSAMPDATHEWNHERWRSAVNPKAACVGYRVAHPLPPGGSIASGELERVVRIRDVLGDSLPAGRYRVTASVSFSNQSPIEVAAGEVELRRR